MNSHSDVTRTILGMIFIVILGTATALPPDFFRNGLYQQLLKKTVDRRAGSHVPGKRSFTERSLLSVACSFCGQHTGLHQVEQACIDDVDIRQLCLSAFSNELEFLMYNKENNSWEK